MILKFFHDNKIIWDSLHLECIHLKALWSRIRIKRSMFHWLVRWIECDLFFFIALISCFYFYLFEHRFQIDWDEITDPICNRNIALNYRTIKHIKSLIVAIKITSVKTILVHPFIISFHTFFFSFLLLDSLIRV